MTIAEMRAAIELSRAAGHSKVPVPITVLLRLIRQAEKCETSVKPS